jgi:hypothetical protein
MMLTATLPEASANLFIALSANQTTHARSQTFAPASEEGRATVPRETLMEDCRRRSTPGAMAYGDGGRSNKRNTEESDETHKWPRHHDTHCLAAEATSSEGSGRRETNGRAGPGRAAQESDTSHAS